LASLCINSRDLFYFRYMFIPFVWNIQTVYFNYTNRYNLLHFHLHCYELNIGQIIYRISYFVLLCLYPLFVYICIPCLCIFVYSICVYLYPVCVYLYPLFIFISLGWGMCVSPDCVYLYPLFVYICVSLGWGI
jgi:hypothetical protein